MSTTIGGFGYNQWGTGSFSRPVFTRAIIPTVSAVYVGTPVQYYINDTLSDGSIVTMSNSNIIWASSNPAAAEITATGFVTTIAPGTTTISGVIHDGNVEVYTSALTVLPLPTDSYVEEVPFYRSHLTQVLLNYFDIQDNRLREEPYTIDAQLLNLAAMALDDKNQRISRELSSWILNNCPTQIDNFGVYYKTYLPTNYILSPGQTELNSCVGIKPTGATVINPYDDRYPVPSEYILDSERTVVGMTNPILFDIIGSGDIINKVWNIQSLGPYSLSIPNKLVFWAENVLGSNMYANVFIQGDEYPKPVWLDEQTGTSETLYLQNEGYYESVLVWQDISSITIRNLPAGVRLRCWQVPCELPAVPDKVRPYTHPIFRDTLFDRYWDIDLETNLLKEVYMMDNFSTLEYIQSYSMVETLTDVVIEPDTWGILGTSGSNLYYWDRREPFPNQLDSTAITISPLYGINVTYDIFNKVTTPSVVIIPKAYGNYANMQQWRYVCQNPSGTLSVILPNGTTTGYTGTAGWQTQSVPTVIKNFSLPLYGTYLFTIECFGADGKIYVDNFPYPNLVLPTTNVYNISSLTPNSLRSVFYDWLKRLWIWDGTNLIPIKPVYDYYVLDTANRVIYFTNEYMSVSYT